MRKILVLLMALVVTVFANEWMGNYKYGEPQQWYIKSNYGNLNSNLGYSNNNDDSEKWRISIGPYQKDGHQCYRIVNVAENKPINYNNTIGEPSYDRQNYWFFSDEVGDGSYIVRNCYNHTKTLNTYTEFRLERASQLDANNTNKLVWAKEFNYNSDAEKIDDFNLTFRKGRMFHGTIMGWSGSYVSPDWSDVKVGNGYIKLITKKENRHNDHWDRRQNNNGIYNWIYVYEDPNNPEYDKKETLYRTGAMLHTTPKWLYGIFECRWKLATTLKEGHSFAFWTTMDDKAFGYTFTPNLDPNSGPYEMDGGEVDIMEYYIRRDERGAFAMANKDFIKVVDYDETKRHWVLDTNYPSRYWETSPDWGKQAWHISTMEWRTDKIIIYSDGIKVNELTYDNLLEMDKDYEYTNFDYDSLTKQFVRDDTGLPKVVYLSDDLKYKQFRLPMQIILQAVTGLAFQNMEDYGEMDVDFLRVYQTKRQATIDFVNMLYRIYNHRHPKQNEFNYYFNKLINNEFSAGLAVKYRSYHLPANDTKVDNRQFLTNLYRTLLKRNPDEGGFNYWVSELNNGSKTRGEVMRAFADTNEFKAIWRNYQVGAPEW